MLSMDEAIRCDRVALVQGGKILQIAPPSEIGKRYPLPLIEIIGPERYKMLLALRKAPHAQSVYPFGIELHFTDDRQGYDPNQSAKEVKDFLTSNGFSDVQVQPIDAGIEDSFMNLMSPMKAAS